MAKGYVKVRRSGIKPASPERVVYMIVIDASFPLSDLESPKCQDTDTDVFCRLAGLAAMQSVRIVPAMVTRHE